MISISYVTTLSIFPRFPVDVQRTNVKIKDAAASKQDSDVQNLASVRMDVKTERFDLVRLH
jgi:hypothetical protein